MATEKEMHELVGRAVIDAEFRTKIKQDPIAAAQELGFSLTPEQLEALQSTDGKGLADLLDERLPKSGFLGYFW